jgi:hypothetical protein
MLEQVQEKKGLNVDFSKTGPNQESLTTLNITFDAG